MNISYLYFINNQSANPPDIYGSMSYPVETRMRLFSGMVQIDPFGPPAGSTSKKDPRFAVKIRMIK